MVSFFLSPVFKTLVVFLYIDAMAKTFKGINGANLKISIYKETGK